MKKIARYMRMLLSPNYVVMVECRTWVILLRPCLPAAILLTHKWSEMKSTGRTYSWSFVPSYKILQHEHKKTCGSNYDKGLVVNHSRIVLRDLDIFSFAKILTGCLYNIFLDFIFICMQKIKYVCMVFFIFYVITVNIPIGSYQGNYSHGV